MAKLVESQRARVPAAPARTEATKRGPYEPVPTRAHSATPTSRIPPGPGIRVEAIQVGYFDHGRRRIGDVFSIHTEQEFSSRWMRKVASNTPPRETRPNEAISREHDAILGGKRPAILTGPDDVPDDLPVGTRNPLDA